MKHPLVERRGPAFVFLFRTNSAMAALRDGLASAFAGSHFLSLEEEPLGTWKNAIDSSAARPEDAIVVALLCDPPPEAQSVHAFLRGAERCLVTSEKRAIAVPVMASDARACNDALESAFPDGHSAAAHLGAEPIFAVKGVVLDLFLPAGAALANLDWAAFAREINLYGFSVERVPVAVELPEHAVRSPFSVDDAASLVALSTEKRSPAVAIDLSRLSHSYNGTTEYSLSLGRNLVRTAPADFEWVVIADEACTARFALNEWNVRIVAPDRVDRLFELVFVPYQVHALAHLKFLAAVSLRFAVCVLDVIALRCEYILHERPSLRAISSAAVQHANLLMSLSKASAEDIRSYYESDGLELEVAPVLITKDVPAVHGTSGSPYVLVIGNRYHHKAISLFLRSFLAAPVSILLIVIADGATEASFKGTPNLEVVVSGKIPEDRMDALYDNASVVVFPSLYEGFGLPVLGGLLRGKPVLAIDNQVNRELKENFDGANQLTLFPSHVAIVEHLHGMDLRVPAEVRQTPSREAIRSWVDVAEETSRLLAKAYREPIEWPAVFARNRDIRNMLEVSTVRADQEAFLRTLSFQRLGRIVVKKVIERLRP